MTPQPAPTDPAPPAFAVVAGSPTDEELAALTVLLAALRRERGRPRPPTSRAVLGGWASRWANVRQPFVPGRDAWRATIHR